MPVADCRTYCEMIDRAAENKFAYPAVNVTSLTTVNATFKGLAECQSDGIIQVSTGGGAFASGSTVKDMALGAISIAEHVHRVAERYPIYVALHTDHCQKKHLDTFVIPLIEETERRRAAGQPNLFSSHMFDGSDIPLSENLDIAVGLLERCHRNEIILEVEVGIVGGEEDGVKGETSERMYTTPEDLLETARRLNTVKGARYLVAATFGNVHGVYKPGHVKLEPKVLRNGQQALEGVYGKEGRFAFVFHGGSGSALEEIHEAIEYGVVKMNVDTDMQYAFTRAVTDHVMKHYDGVLRIDGDVGSKKAYDPRTYLTLAEGSMAERVKQAARELKSVGTTLCKV